MDGSLIQTKITSSSLSSGEPAYFGGRTFEPCCWQGTYHMCAVGKMTGQTGLWYRFAASFTRGSGIKFYINNVMDAEVKDFSKPGNPLRESGHDYNHGLIGVNNVIRMAWMFTSLRTDMVCFKNYLKRPAQTTPFMDIS